jgi:phage-related protein
MELITEIVDTILPPLLDIFNELAEIVLPLVITVFESLVPIIEPIMQNIANIINIILAAIKGDWEGVWEGIKEYLSNGLNTITGIVEGFGEIFGEIFEGIKKVVLGVWDGIVDGIKEAINWIIGGINTFIRGINKIKIPDWVPGVGGKGLNIKEIPKLAEGGEIVQRGHAIVGEAGPELLELPQGAKVKPLTPDENEDVSGKTIIEGNNFYIREESDIKKVARELFKLTEQKRRGGLTLA